MLEAISQGKKLVVIISELLEKHNHPYPKEWENRLHPDVFISEDPSIQRFLINRYWRQEIGLYPENTISVRHCLIDQGSYEDWLRLFEIGVIPCVLKNIQLKKLF